MRLFYLEVKRIMKSRRTIILLAAALFLAIIMAYLPISFESINRPGENGSVVELNGMEAIQFSGNTGKIPMEKLHHRKLQTLYEYTRNMFRNMAQ